MNEQQKRENTLYLVVPCYNEEEVLLHTAEVMLVKLKRLIKEGKISSKSKVMFVNDGSRDNTWNLINALCKQSVFFSGLKFFPELWSSKRYSGRYDGCQSSCGYGGYH